MPLSSRNVDTEAQCSGANYCTKEHSEASNDAREWLIRQVYREIMTAPTTGRTLKDQKARLAFQSPNCQLRADWAAVIAGRARKRVELIAAVGS
jgi:hypothetical protein